MNTALWNIIRDFFVEYVWGGTLSNGYQRGGRFGSCLASDGSYHLINMQQIYFPIDAKYYDNTSLTYINFADWLSTTSAIITFVVILIVIAYFIRWIFKVCSNAILLR